MSNRAVLGEKSPAFSLRPLSKTSRIAFSFDDMLEETYDSNDVRAAIRTLHAGESNYIHDRLKDKLVFSLQEEEWFGFNGVVWERLVEAKMNRYFAKVLQAHLARFQGEGPDEQCEKRIRALNQLNGWSVLGTACKELFTQRVKWNSDPYLVAVENGVLDLHQREFSLIQAEPRQFISRSLSVAFDEDALAERWEQFIEEIFPDTNTAEFIQRFFGRCLLREYREAVFLILYGPMGRNGKDVLIRAIQGVLGSFCGVIPVTELMVKQNQSGGNLLYVLEDLMLAVVSEPASNAELDLAMVKLITGGGNVLANKKYQDPYAFALTALFVLLTNHKPRLARPDSAFAERLLLVQMTERFVENPDPEKPNEHKVDYALAETLKKEKAGILNWLILGWFAYQEVGLCPPQAVLDERQEYIREEDILGRFLEDKCEITKDANVFTKLDDLYKAYKEWFEGEGMRYPMTKQSFSKMLSEKGLIKDRRKLGTGFAGIKILN